MTDAELEMRLRDLRVRADDVPPPPADLSERTRTAYRVERRRRARLAAAGVAAALVLVGVPAAAGVLEPLAGRQQAAAPADPTRAPLPSLYEEPTRGSLAGDTEWLAGVRGLSWVPEEAHDLPPDFELPDPAVDERRVTFADEVAGGRVALVVARTERHGLVRAWFTGPGDATPGQMALVGIPLQGTRAEPSALLTTLDSGSARQALVVVGMRGDEAQVLTGRTVTAAAAIVENWEHVPMTDGAGSLVMEHGSVWRTSGLEMRVARDGQLEPIFPQLWIADDATAALGGAPVDIADPRGLRASVDETELLHAVTMLASRYGADVEQLRPTLLAAGPVDGSRNTAFLVGVTFPSGATGATLTEFWVDRHGQASTSFGSMTLAPAGTGLLDQVFAVPTSNSITVSGPDSGVLAEIYLRDGTLHATVPLVDGAGVGPLGPPAADRVRILDVQGGVVVEAPLSRPNG